MRREYLDIVVLMEHGIGDLLIPPHVNVPLKTLNGMVFIVDLIPMHPLVHIYIWYKF